MLSTDYLYKDRLFNGEFSREEFDRLQCPLTNQNLTASIVGAARYYIKEDLGILKRS